MRKSARTQIPPFFDNDPYNVPYKYLKIVYFVCFVALRPSQQLWSWGGGGGGSVHLTTLFPGQA